MRRRVFLKNVGLVGGGAVPRDRATGGRRTGRDDQGSITTGGLQPLDGGKIGNTPAMKITDIKTFLVGARRPQLGLCESSDRPGNLRHRRSLFRRAR